MSARRAHLYTVPPWSAIMIAVTLGILLFGWPLWLIVAVPFALLPFLSFWLDWLESGGPGRFKQARTERRRRRTAGAH